MTKTLLNCEKSLDSHKGVSSIEFHFCRPVDANLSYIEEMLKNCEACLKKSYGENLERLISLTVMNSNEIRVNSSQ